LRITSAGIVVRPLTSILAIALFLVPGPGAEAAVSPRRARRAEALYEQAQRDLARSEIDARRKAIKSLEEAALLDPGNATYSLALARAFYQAGFLKSARQRFQKVVDLTPRDAEGRYGLAEVWRRDWLKYVDKTSLARAIENYTACVTLKPSHCDGWIALVPLLVERDSLVRAAAAAESARAADPGRADALLAVGYTAYRLGNLALADSAFRMAFPYLSWSVRRVFDEIGPVATERDTQVLNRLPRPERKEFLRRFWTDLDPDLTTPENEAQLEFWARAAHGYFLYYNHKRREWDVRGELYARYGPPASIDYNPLGTPLRDVFGLPRNVLIWWYPELGMHAFLEDNILAGSFNLPITRDYDPDPRPSPVAVAQQDGLVSGEGRGVFHRLPPGVQPIPIRGAIARFEGEKGPLLMADVETPSGPSDSLSAQWVVMDSSSAVVMRGSGALVPSACDGAERQSAQFAAELPPGRYTVGLTVRDGKGGRGILREEALLGPPGVDLGLSDVVIVCGTPDLALAAGDGIRLEPNPAAVVRGNDPLHAYFEIYRLDDADGGLSRFEYVYTVRSAEKDRRFWLQRVFQPRPGPPQISATREEEQAGRMRRQFVTVPVGALPAGRYRLEVRVRDLGNGAEAQRVAEFVKTSSGPLQN
jgi:GWxTD domain-containing protein